MAKYKYYNHKYTPNLDRFLSGSFKYLNNMKYNSHWSTANSLHASGMPSKHNNDLIFQKPFRLYAVPPSPMFCHSCSLAPQTEVVVMSLLILIAIRN